ncbi:MAG TPA: prolipoprotein diacylglyceryl transferase family protein [Pyrinomonadaceae bacterium]|nr:prolipoprotein diacylglyceryl transferase family protein [Pyrinomonadaceae bacterium]
MTSALFVAGLTTFFAVLFYWGFRKLPAEGWQIIAAVPLKRGDDGSWSGRNLTYYGFFNASACAFSYATVVLLMGTVNVPLIATLTVTCTLLLICVPAARLIARAVEGKLQTFTIAGASLTGIIVLPWLIEGFNASLGRPLGAPVPVIQMFGAVAIAYAFGEAFGRLACISFGCCYGKPFRQLSTPLQPILRRYCFVFRGETKKVAYEGELSGMPLVPIQAITAIVSALAGLVGLIFFLGARWTEAVLIPIATTQIWRALSETWRADYRGGGRVSAYQIMALFNLVYVLAVLSLLEPTVTPHPNILTGLRSLTYAPSVLLIEMLWVAIFLYVGRSSVTAARLSFHVVRERI